MPVTAPRADPTAVADSGSLRDVSSDLLAFTGDNIGLLALVGAALLAVGGVLGLTSRRRRRA